mgnify:CR=1 FL=1
MKVRGSIVALITPMHADGSVDFESLTRLIEFHIESGTHGIVSVGTTGESATLSVAEHLAVIEHSVKVVDGRIPLIAGTGANATSEAIELSRRARSVGADACLSVVPYYNKPNQAGLIAHYKSIADSVDLPLILYNVPGRTVADLHNQSVVELMHHENIIAIKDATGDLRRGKELIDLTKGHLDVLSGDDGTALELIKMGAVGDISVTANVAPSHMSRLCDYALAGKFLEAEELDRQLRTLHQLLFIEANPIPVKYAVSKLGYTHNALRLPLVPLAEQYRADLDKALEIVVKKF